MKYIPLTQGKFAIVDDEDFSELSKLKWWYLSAGGYAVYTKRIGVRSIKNLMHKLLMGSIRGLEIDHLNGDGLDNRKNNLRFCTHRQNIQNQKKRWNKKFKGTCFLWDRRKWRASITLEGKTIYLGTYLTETEAGDAYSRAALKYFGRFARINESTCQKYS